MCVCVCIYTNQLFLVLSHQQGLCNPFHLIRGYRRSRFHKRFSFLCKLPGFSGITIEHFQTALHVSTRIMTSRLESSHLTIHFLYVCVFFYARRIEIKRKKISQIQMSLFMNFLRSERLKCLKDVSSPRYQQQQKNLPA